MATVHQWTGLEARALRHALRLSVRRFAEGLGVAINTVSKWERLLAETKPNGDSQAILDTALARADATVHLRFETFLSQAGPASPDSFRRVVVPRPRAWQYEEWADDLDRVIVALSSQKFDFAEELLRRWTPKFEPSDLDDRGLYLLARSTAMLGDLRRDRGQVLGPLSAQRSYAGARSIFDQLVIPRRVAQLDLSLAVVAEMGGNLDGAARRYEDLAADDRLTDRDRARARLWVGTALSKDGEHDYAAQAMRAAIQDFDRLAEPDDWAVAHQKLALASRGAGDLNTALRLIDVARSAGVADSPMQRVRLETAYGHILVSDPGTLEDGLRTLDSAQSVAAEYGLAHQLRSIEGIRAFSHGLPARAQ
jgi:transcriptional regulator with XRE-family HTH domain